VLKSTSRGIMVKSKKVTAKVAKPKIKKELKKDKKIVGKLSK